MIDISFICHLTTTNSRRKLVCAVDSLKRFSPSIRPLLELSDPSYDFIGNVALK